MENHNCFKPIILKPSQNQFLIEEKVEFQKIRLFKWNKKNCHNKTSCLLILNLFNDIYSSNELRHIHFSTKHFSSYMLDADIFFFDQEVAERYIRMAADESDFFISDETVRTLAKDVINFIFGCFRFNISSFYETTTPTYVIMMDIFTSVIHGAPTIFETHLIQENFAPYLADDNYIDDFVKEELLTEVGDFIMKANSDQEIKGYVKEEDIMVVKPLIKETYYNVVDEMNGDKWRCSICFEGYNSETIAITPCSHNFHDRCLLKWMLRSDSCPLCRGVCVKHV